MTLRSIFAMTLEGRYDRNVLPTRETVNGKLQLRDEGRPEHEDKWNVVGDWRGD